MIILSETCQAECSYCFGPNKGAVMCLKTAKKTVKYIHNTVRTTGQNRVSITFHGGEPLLAPLNIWQFLLHELSLALKGRKVHFHIQTNLLNLSAEHCRLFSQYNVQIGTSLDGPELLNDFHRGKGYYKHHREKLKLADSFGLDVGFISTITPESRKKKKELFTFFEEEDRSFSIHPSLPPLKSRQTTNGSKTPYITADQYSEFLVELLNEYIPKRWSMRISSLDDMVRGVAWGDPQICTFNDCLGLFIVIGPDGDYIHAKEWLEWIAFVWEKLEIHQSIA